MKKCSKQDLSCLLDNELEVTERDALIAALVDEQQAGESESITILQRYQLMRHGIKRNGVSMQSDMVSRVAQALVDEPVHNCDVIAEQQQQAAPKGQPKNTAVPQVRSGVLRQHPAIYALAASVMLAVVLTYNPFLPKPNQTVQLVAQTEASQSPVAVASVPDSLRQELDMLYVSHAQFGNISSLNGMGMYAQLLSN